jgi:hypothetical protein
MFGHRDAVEVHVVVQHHAAPVIDAPLCQLPPVWRAWMAKLLELETVCRLSTRRTAVESCARSRTVLSAKYPQVVKLRISATTP